MFVYGVTLFGNQNSEILLKNGRNQSKSLDFPAERCYNFLGYQVNSPHRVTNSAKEIVVLCFPHRWRETYFTFFHKGL